MARIQLPKWKSFGEQCCCDMKANVWAGGAQHKFLNGIVAQTYDLEFFRFGALLGHGQQEFFDSRKLIGYESGAYFQSLETKVDSYFQFHGYDPFGNDASEYGYDMLWYGNDLVKDYSGYGYWNSDTDWKRVEIQIHGHYACAIGIGNAGRDFCDLYYRNAFLGRYSSVGQISSSGQYCYCSLAPNETSLFYETRNISSQNVVAYVASKVVTDKIVEYVDWSDVDARASARI